MAEPTITTAPSSIPTCRETPSSSEPSSIREPRGPPRHLVPGAPDLVVQAGGQRQRARVGPVSARRRCPEAWWATLPHAVAVRLGTRARRGGAPAGTGIPLPKGSLVVMQIHYNLLVGDEPVRGKLVLPTVPATTPLRPINLALMPAPPDVPCPAGVTGPLCIGASRSPSSDSDSDRTRSVREYARDDLRTKRGRAAGRRHHVVLLGPY